MAATIPAPSTGHQPAVYCGFHHGPVDRCPPLVPELGDLLPDLLARGVDVQLVPQPARGEQCADCISCAVAYVCFRAPSEALPEGFTSRTATCAEHLWPAVSWPLRRGSDAWIEIFHDFGLEVR